MKSKNAIDRLVLIWLIPIAFIVAFLSCAQMVHATWTPGAFVCAECRNSCSIRGSGDFEDCDGNCHWHEPKSLYPISPDADFVVCNDKFQTSTGGGPIWECVLSPEGTGGSAINCNEDEHVGGGVCHGWDCCWCQNTPSGDQCVVYGGFGDYVNENDCDAPSN